jgi:hypothetical protein
MSKVNYTASSPYVSTPQASWYIKNYVHRPIPESTDDTEFTITKLYENRPDKLSLDLYGSPEYWWIFSVRNRNILKDPVWDMTTGTVIMVPTFATLKQALSL